MGWILNGKECSDEEYAEYQKQELKRWQADEAEVQRLVVAVGEAFTACEKFMEEHPRYPYGLKDDAQQREFKIYQKLRDNLERAGNAPRCEKVREDGTVCGCPQMKGYRYCYAHERMLQMQSQKLELPSVEDANGIQMAIMRVQKALIDDEISEKKAGLLLYSLQMASSNLKHTSFAKAGERATVEMPEPPRASGSQTPTSKKQVLPLIHTDDTDRKPAVSTRHSAPSQNKPEHPPRRHGDTEKGKHKVPPTYAHALPIPAKNGRERVPDCARSLHGRRDDGGLDSAECPAPRK